MTTTNCVEVTMTVTVNGTSETFRMYGESEDSIDKAVRGLTFSVRDSANDWAHRLAGGSVR